MALSGSFKTSGWTSSSGDVASLLFEWTAEQSPTNNTSTISWTLKGHRTKASGYVMAGGFKVVIDGETVYSKSTDYRIEMRNGTVIASGKKTITHKGDGTRSFTVYVEGGIYYYDVNCKGTNTFTLDTIPRASTVTFPKSYIGSNPTILINSASPNFSHTLLYRADYEAGKPWIPIVEKTTDTTITSWTIPNGFYYTIPNDKKTHIWIECITYNGNAEIGRHTTQYIWFLYANEADCIPDISGTVVDLNQRATDLTGDDPDVIIKGGSLAHCVATITPKNGASISKLLVNGLKADTVKNSDGTVTGVIDFSGPDTGTFDFYVEDSRGYYNSCTVTKTLIPYIPLTANITAKRTDPTNGNATITIEGNCYKGHFGVESNRLKITYVQGTGKPDEVTAEITDDNKYKVTIPLTDLLYTESFDYDIIVEDALSTVAKTATIGKGIPVFDWGEDDFNFNVPVTIKGVDILKKLAELEELVAAKG